MDRDLEKYILDHSTPEDEVLEDLFRQTHIRFVNPNMSCGHLQGKLLEMISRMVSPECILEIGTFTGYSTICLARGLKPGGVLITVEPNDEIAEFTGQYLKKAGVDEKVVRITGRVQDVIVKVDKQPDLVYIDGDKREYCDYYRIVIEKVKPGGYIIADNVLWGGKIQESDTNDQQTRGIIEFNEMICRQENVENIIMPVRDGIMLIRKVN